MSSTNETTKRGGLLNPDFKYTPSDRTNILETFRRLTGWTPPTKSK